MDRIPVDQLKVGYLYKIKARNSNCGIYQDSTISFSDFKPTGQFEIARTKFAHTFIDQEYDRASGPPFGTATPYEEIEKAPDFWEKEDKLKYLLEWRERLGGEY